MRKVNFYWANQGSILARFNYSYQVLKVGTGLIVPAEFWDSETQRVKATKKFPFHVSYNLRLNKIEETILGTYFRFQVAGEVPTRNDFLDDLGANKVKLVQQDSMTLTKFMDMFLKERRESGTYALESYKVYKAVIDKFKEFSAKYGRKYDFKDIDMTFFFGFMKFLAPENFATNYLNKIIGTLKTILNDAKERGYNPYDAYKSKKFSIPRVKTTKIYLNEEELLKLFNHKFEYPHHRNAVDLFLLGAWSSFRDSDFRKLIQENVEMYKGKEII